MTFVMHLPANIFFMRNGTSPIGESFPPSTLNPKPAISFITVTISRCSCLATATTEETSKTNFYIAILLLT